MDKKNDVVVDNPVECAELDELYWFLERKGNAKTRENVYIMTMVNRNPRQIVGCEVTISKSSVHIQRMVDNGPEAKRYCTDGYYGYLDVIYPGEHVYNDHDKSDTFTVEGVNADLRHYIPVLARRSRCFCRSIETLKAVIDVFVDAYNRFGLAKYSYRLTHIARELPFALVDFL